MAPADLAHHHDSTVKFQAVPEIHSSITSLAKKVACLAVLVNKRHKTPISIDTLARAQSQALAKAYGDKRNALSIELLPSNQRKTTMRLAGRNEIMIIIHLL